MREWNSRQGGTIQRLELRADSVHFLERLPAEGESPEGPEPDPGSEELPF